MNQPDDEQLKQQKESQLITEFLENNNLYEALNEYLEKQNIDLGDINYTVFLEFVEQHDSNLMKELLANMNNLENIELYKKKKQEQEEYQYDIDIDTESNKEQLQEEAMREGQISHLKLEIGKGTHFKIDNENQDDLQLMIFMNFLSCRYYTKPVNVSANPVFNQEFEFPLYADDARNIVDQEVLKKLNQKLELVVALVNKKDTLKREILSTKIVEWRFILIYPSSQMNIELGKYQNENEIVGTLQIHMTGYPDEQMLAEFQKKRVQQAQTDNKKKSKKNLPPMPPRKFPSEKLMHEQLKQEKKLADYDIQMFYQYCQKWWNNYLKNFSGKKKRIVKIYAENEFGQFIPVSTTVTPLYNVYGIDCPQQAARFISLIPFKKDQMQLGKRKEIWNKFHTILVRRQADIEDHCTFLCSLLLGLGIDAYVVMGTNYVGYHCWVLSLEKQNNGQTYYLFWETLQGKCYKQNDPKVLELFKKVGCAFNHNMIYANIQKEDYAPHTEFNFHNSQNWYRMDDEQLARAAIYNNQIMLKQSGLNVYKMEEAVESFLKKKFIDLRSCLSTPHFEFDILNILGQELISEENNFVFGKQVGMKEFNQCLNNYKKKVELEINSARSVEIQIDTIKQNFIQFNPQKIFNQFKKDLQFDKIWHLKSTVFKFAFKAKVFPYPDNFYVIWVGFCAAFELKVLLEYESDQQNTQKQNQK